jgi:hypothetical protein
MDFLFSILFSLREITETILTVDDRITRTGELYSVMQSVTKIHKASADTGIHNNVWITHSLPYYIEKIGKAYPDDSKSVTESLCNLSVYSIGKGCYYEINELGISGINLVDDYPELTLIILNTLYKAIGSLKKKKKILRQEKGKSKKLLMK